MFNFSKKKTLYCVLGIILSVIVMALCLTFGVEDKGITEIPIWAVILRYIALSCLSIILALIFYIFASKQIFWYTFLLMQGYLTLYVILQFTMEFSTSITAVIISVLILSILCFIFVRDFKNKQILINGVSDENISKKQQKEIQEIKQLLIEDERIKNEISYLNKSIIVGSQLSGALYQMIKDDYCYYFHYLGNILKGIDEKKFINNFDNIDDLIAQNKKDYKIDKSEILKIKSKINCVPQTIDYGNLTILLNNGKKKRFSFINLIEENELKIFFEDNIEIKNVTKIENEEETPITYEKKEKLNLVNLFVLIYSLVSSFIMVFYLFFNNEYLNHTLSVLGVIIAISSFEIYIALNKYLIIESNQQVVGEKLSYGFQFFIFPIALAIKCLFNLQYIIIYDYVKLIIYSAILLAILLVLFFLFTSEYKKKKIVIVAVIFTLLFLLPSCIAKINSGLDFSTPQEVVCVVVDKSTSAGSDETYYYLTINYNNKEIKAEVNEEKYNSTEIGENIIVLECKGLLGIEKVVFK